MTRADSIRFGALAMQAGGGGVSTYARELIHEIAACSEPTDELSALVQTSGAAALPSRVTPIPVPNSSGVRRAARGKIPTGRVDVFHSLDADLPIAGPRSTVATIHDLSVFDVPWAFGKFRAYGEQALVRHTLRTADVIVAVSNFTAQRILEISGRESQVTPLAPASWTRVPDPAEVDDVRTRLGLPDRYVLQVGTIEPRKRPHVVAEAARALDIPCVLAGAGTRGGSAPASAIGLGYVDVADLPALYRGATAVAYASVYEGFGLPPVEAMACGAVVVASAVGALPDVAGDGAVLVHSHRLGDWIDALREVVEDPDARSDLGKRAIDASAALTWRATAELTLAAYARAGMPA